MGTAPAVRPRLKSVIVKRFGAEIVITHRALERLHLEDESGALAALLTLLATGAHGPAALLAILAQQGFPVTAEEVDAALTELDRLGLLERADAELALEPHVRERHRSNLRFFDLFSNLGKTSADMQRAAMRGHVLILGAGGMGSSVLQSLAGLGVRKVTIVDFDTVEIGNLARQFLYGPESIGQSKVECAARWMRSYSPDTEVVAVCRRITDAASIVGLAGDADVVVHAIDTPDDIQLIVNEACFTLGVPMVLGGLQYSTLGYWSVQPGVSPCRRCLDLKHRDEESTLPEVIRTDPIINMEKVNRATGPVVQLAGGLVSLEVMRYLVGIEPPVAAATYHVMELTGGMATERTPWQHHPECELCPPKP